MAATEDALIAGLKQQRVVPELRFDDPALGLQTARALFAGKLAIIEVSLAAASAGDVLAALAKTAGVTAGVGGVISPRDGKKAVAGGAVFLSSPGFSADMAKRAKGFGALWMPGVTTPGDVMQAMAAGFNLLRYHPADPDHGVAALAHLVSLFPKAWFMPAGVTSAAAASAYLANERVLAVCGAWMIDKEAVAAQDWASLTAAALACATIGAPSEGRFEPPATPADEVTAQTDGHAISPRLRRLNGLFEPIANDAAHVNELLDDVNFQSAVTMLADPSVPLTAIRDYAFGSKWTLAAAALVACRRRDDANEITTEISERLGEYSPWLVQLSVPLLSTGGAKLFDRALASSFREWWTDNSGIHQAMSDWLAALGADAPDAAGPELRELPSTVQDRLKQFLKRVRHPAADAIAAGLKSGPTAEPGSTRSILESAGRIWKTEGDDRHLVEPAGWRQPLDTAEALFRRRPIRSVIVSGEPMVGKTSFLRLLARRLASDGWRVFESSGADLQAGQIYIGQLEARLKQLLDEIGTDRKLVWYVPDLLQLARSGSHQGQSATMLDQVLPAIAEGRIVLFAEATPTAAARLMQTSPVLRRLMDVVRLEPLDDEETEELAEKLCASLARAKSLTVEANAARTAVEAAAHHLGGGTLPGSALALVRLTAERAATESSARLSPSGILSTLSGLTGLPLSILDGAERLDLAELRTFFSARVIGQPQAVECVVERIAMLKAGLNDPGKPIGVLLFAGPTGTGKTELAKAVAEYLFGSVERMVRLDMSEYQSADATAKIVGTLNASPDSETLITRVRKQPFSLLLLDEFEKSNPLVWDLFLQVFDEGRLTDAAGQTADFRHCLIVLTTNLGATDHQSSMLGFAPSQGTYGEDQIMTAIGRAFRPEFQNRLDKVIVFRPLTRDLMRSILQKELARLFERRGLKDRDWAIEWEASALEFLLEKGFSPTMGARPLKRAIEQYVVAPLAATIVERRFPEGDQFVFMRSSGDALKADFVDPDGDGEPYDRSAEDISAGDAPSLAAMVLAPEGSAREGACLEELADAIQQRIEDPAWSDAKAALADAMAEPAFWSSDERFAVLSRYALMDRLALAAETVTALRQRLSRRSGQAASGAPRARELIARLALQIHLVRAGFVDFDQSCPVEIAIAVESAFDGAADRDAQIEWRDRVAGMYRNWAERRSMQVRDLATSASEPPLLVVSGFGAHRVLASEVGLHVLEQREGGSRIAARVVALPTPAEDMPKGRLRAVLAGALSHAPRSSSVVRRYRTLPSPLVRNGDGSWRTGKLDAVLAGDFDLLLDFDA